MAEWKPGTPWNNKYLKPGEKAPDFDPNEIAPDAKKTGPGQFDYEWFPFKDGKEWSQDPKTGVWGYYVTDAAKKYFADQKKLDELAKSNVGESAVAEGKKKSAVLAKTLPQVNPKTGVTSDLFQGLYGVFETLIDDPTYGAELREIKAALAAGNQALADDLWNRSKWGRLDNDAQNRILLSKQNETLYKERLKSWLIGIKSKLAGKGLKADDAKLEEYYKNGIDDITIIDELTSGISAKGAAGEAADALGTLRGVARANGFNLDKDFGLQLDGWLQRISKGESVDDFARLIRQQAKLGLPEKVGALVDEGLDLANIYAPYRNRMAALLEVSPDSINLDDPLLRSAYGQDKEMSIYDFQRAVRKDPRWQYTDNAREEVSNVALQVLRDFGFQG